MHESEPLISWPVGTPKTCVPRIRHWRLTLLTILLGWPLLIFAKGVYQDTALSTDRTRLVIIAANGERFDAPKLPDQVGFDRPLVSPDGKYVGWLALFPNCCTSYPVPLAIVILNRSRQVHLVERGAQPAFAWCFSPDSLSIAYWQSVLHGSDFRHYELRAIKNNRLLAEYDYPHDESDRNLARQNAPAWVGCVQD